VASLPQKTASARLTNCATSTTRRRPPADRKRGIEVDQRLPPNVLELSCTRKR
jgi:hypothetical protein